MTHAFYVYASYGFAALVTVAVTLWTWADGRARRRELASLEASGIRRRSARTKGDE
ncbi:cytochrome-c heme transporter protein CcmD/CycX [Rhizobium sp. CIAT894]|uniref:heme exporter protein CcmD n=1 Tax=Rhizobium sp. CIAT894 TaxID=2020312 RepID=UPI000190A0BD|nr:heme exporter protein CcmD [Rhizobium sp. CIAT894]ARM90380.1 cytochrome-c heme transporter protein CcmD/CycX [Rhizobium sp. CIAT894]